MKNYRDDPRWLTTRYPGACRQCGASIPRDARAFYYPRNRALLCETCGKPAAAEFAAAAFDEEHNACL